MKAEIKDKVYKHKNSKEYMKKSVIVVCLFAVLALSLIGMVSAEDIELSSQDLENGIILNLTTSDKVYFPIGDSREYISVLSISIDSAEFYVHTQKNTQLFFGENHPSNNANIPSERMFEMNHDEFYDIRVTFLSSSVGADSRNVEIKIEGVNEPIPEGAEIYYDCWEFYECSDGTKIRKCEYDSDGRCGCRAISPSECPSNEEDNLDTSCKNLYWFDNDNKNCSQKQFCGVYMYLGLQTFDSKTQCEKALNENISVEQITDINHKISSEDLIKVEELFSKNNLNLSNFQIIKFTEENYGYIVKANRIYNGLRVFLGGDVVYQFNEEGIKVYEAGMTSEITNEISIIPVISKEEAAKKASEKSGFSNIMTAELGIANKKVGMGYKNPDWTLAWKINNKNAKYPIAFIDANNGNVIYYDDGIREIDNKCPADKEDGKCYKTLSNGRKAEIKIMPETASATAIAKLGDLGFTIELKEVGKGDDVKPIYELTGNKQGKFLGIFKIIAKVQAQIDAETGNVKVIKPWWSFLATNI